MSEKITGLLEVQDSSATPKVRVTLSGDDGTAHFEGEKDGSSSTTISNRRVAIGKKPDPPGIKATALVGVLNPLPVPGGEEVVDTSREPKAVLSIGDETLAGGISIIGSNGKRLFYLNGVTGGLTVGGEGNAGEVIVLDSKGEVRVRIDGNTGDIELLGADCAEEFDIDGNPSEIDPGTVMVIGEGGGLRPSQMAYDKRVAGVISGAGLYRPGIVLHKDRTRNGRVPLALSGKVYCKVDASYAPVEIGDLLTTSSTFGFAMKALDPLKVFGTVIGKALQPLSTGQGLIPVLVALQ